MTDIIKNLKKLAGLNESLNEAPKKSSSGNSNSAPAYDPTAYDDSPIGAMRQYDAAKKAGVLPPVTPAPGAAPSGTPPVKTVKTGGGDYPVYPKSSPEAGSFRDAFRAARADQGAGGQFTWQGRQYSTALKGEPAGGSTPPVRPLDQPATPPAPLSRNATPGATPAPANPPTSSVPPAPAPWKRDDTPVNRIGSNTGTGSRFGEPTQNPYTGAPTVSPTPAPTPAPAPAPAPTFSQNDRNSADTTLNALKTPSFKFPGLYAPNNDDAPFKFAKTYQDFKDLGNSSIKNLAAADMLKGESVDQEHMDEAEPTWFDRVDNQNPFDAAIDRLKRNMGLSGTQPGQRSAAPAQTLQSPYSDKDREDMTNMFRGVSGEMGKPGAEKTQEGYIDYRQKPPHPDAPSPNDPNAEKDYGYEQDNPKPKSRDDDTPDTKPMTKESADLAMLRKLAGMR
jgi:hypothetical protein